MKIAYCDCFSGISGDMFLSAMIDAGLPEEYLNQKLQLLNLPELFHLSTETCRKGAISARKLDIELHGQTEVELHHPHTHHHHHDHAHNRNYGEIMGLLDNSGLSGRMKEISKDIFTVLAEAEARVHGTSIEEVHFHEVGAMDSIIDITGAAIALDYFDIEKLYASTLPLTSGSIVSQHGLIPVPAPATMELLTKIHAPMRACESDKELITPTGAAILAAMAEFSKPDFSLDSVGSGAGNLDLPWPNILRIFIGETHDTIQKSLILIETNIDDLNPEILPSVMEDLFNAGALDVYFTPIIMKKNRAGVTLSVIGDAVLQNEFTRLLFQNTSTYGVRVQAFDRHEVLREMKTVSLEYGDIPVKCKILDGKIIQISPEYQACYELAKKVDVPVLTIYQKAMAAGTSLLDI